MNPSWDITNHAVIYTDPMGRRHAINTLDVPGRAIRDLVIDNHRLLEASAIIAERLAGELVYEETAILTRLQGLLTPTGPPTTENCIYCAGTGTTNLHTTCPRCRGRSAE